VAGQSYSCYYNSKDYSQVVWDISYSRAAVGIGFAVVFGVLSWC
jgi:hypothetical protein